MISELIKYMRIGSKETLEFFHDKNCRYFSIQELTIIVEALLFRINEQNNDELLKKVADDLENELFN